MKLTKSYSYTNDVETREFTVRVGVSVDFKFYFARDQIPAEILERTDALLPKRSYADSFYEIDGIITDLIERYEAGFVEETREKVIVYFFQRSEMYQVDGGHEISIAYRVLWKFQTGDDVGYLAEHRRGADVRFEPCRPFSNSDLGRDTKVQEMPWSAERETWFKAICGRVEELARSIKTGIGSTPTVLARKIDQNGALMLPGRGEDDGQD